MRWKRDFKYDFKVGETRTPLLAFGIVLLGFSAFLLVVILSTTSHLRGGALLLLIPIPGLLCVLRGLIPILRGRLFHAYGEYCEGKVVGLELGIPVNGVPPYRLVLSLEVDGCKQTARSEWLYLTDYLPKYVVGGLYPVYVRRGRIGTRFFVEPYAFRDGFWIPPTAEQASLEGDERFTAPAPESWRGKTRTIRLFKPMILCLLLLNLLALPIGVRDLTMGLKQKSQYDSDKNVTVTAYVTDLSIDRSGDSPIYSYYLRYSYDGTNYSQQDSSANRVNEGDSIQIRIMRDHPNVKASRQYIFKLRSGYTIIGFFLAFDLILFLFILLFRKILGSSVWYPYTKK